MIELCLMNNYFMFDKQVYQQLRGVAMGACFSPSYACLHNGWWEEHVLKSTHKELYDAHVLHWWCFIDVCVIWNGSVASAKEFVDTINNNALNLKFTADISNESVQFLDVELYIINETIQTRLHRKFTAGNSVLHASSSHPHHLIRSIPYGEFLRIKRICSSGQDLELWQMDAFQRFRARG